MPATDAFANIAHLSVTESAANTLTFNQLQTGTAIFEKMAMIIHRIEYSPSFATINLLQSNIDDINIAWTTSDQITAIGKQSAQVIDAINLNVLTVPVGNMYTRPLVSDFSTLPSGGLIVPATSLFLAIQGTSVASPGFSRSTIYFTYKSLKGEEFWELVEATRALT